jgi:tRNA-(ms[2]io[6]A)-hydroxylase
VNDLLKFVSKGGRKEERLMDYLLMAAMIEARSCERFRLLSENVNDPELAEFYRELMESEAGHYTMFITLARDLCGREETDRRWTAFLEYEAEIIQRYGQEQSIHG